MLVHIKILIGFQSIEPFTVQKEAQILLCVENHIHTNLFQKDLVGASIFLSLLKFVKLKIKLKN